MITLSELQRDALREVGNIGSGHAAIALSQLMGKRIMIVIPSVEVFLLKDLQHIIDGGQAAHAMISLSVLGEARGVMIFILEKGMAMRLCDIVMGLTGDKTGALGEIEISALKEVGSILTASYLNAVGEMTGISLLISTPSCDIGDMAFIDKILVSRNIATKGTDQVLCVKTEFVESAMKIEGYLVFAPAEDAIEKIINSLGV